MEERGKPRIRGLLVTLSRCLEMGKAGQTKAPHMVIIPPNLLKKTVTRPAIEPVWSISVFS